MIDRFTPSAPQLLRNPYPTYARYRDEDPVHWGNASMSSLSGSWYLFRYEDNAAVLSDAATFASDSATVGIEVEVPAAFAPIRHIHQRWLGGIDPPDHRRLRAIMAKAFTPRRVEELAGRIWDITSKLVDDALAEGTKTIDLWRQMAFPMPMNVIGDALGVKPADWTVFQKWSQDISDAIDRAGDPETGKRGTDAILGLYAYFENLIDERRVQPVDDLFTAMISAADDEGSPMTKFDAITIAIELGFAGHETTTNGISLALIGLLSQEGTWQRAQEALRDKTRTDALLEELLRYTTPVQRQRWRWAARDTEIAGRRISRGESVVSVLGAANRDPLVFANPDTIDFDRPRKKHLTFGIGTHYCLGSHLAKLELETALRILSDRLPKLELAVPMPELPWNNNFLVPGPVALPVVPS